MAEQIFAIIMAAGSGTRMGSEQPKQFLPLGGVPILQRTIERFREALPQARVVTVLPREHFQTWKDLCTQNHLDCPQQLVAGGITRFHSVQNALKVVPDGAIVFIHDGVRPLASVDFLRRLAGQIHQHRALIPVIPVTDTIVSDQGEGVDRTHLRAVQTPQVFRSEDIRAAYTLAYETSFTDDGSVAQRKGIPLSYVEGERYNLKITTPEDLRMAEALLLLAQ